MKVLVVASEPVDEESIDLITKDDEPDEVRVLAPALTGSALRYWMNDTDAAIEKSEEVLGESLSELDAAGIPAAADPVTDDDPSVTIDDALREFGPDRIVVIKHARGDEAYQEEQIIEEIAEYSDAPVEIHAVESRN